MFAKAVSKDDMRVVYIAPTYQQARDICWLDLKKICQPLTVSVHDTRLEIVIKTQTGGTSTIWLRGWESIETLRGQKFDFVVIDEVAMMRNFWNNWEQVISPTLLDRKGDVLFISTPKGFNHFYDLFNTELKDKDFKSFHFTSYDNPYMPVEELDRQRISLTPDAFAQEFLAEFKKKQGLVYPEFDRSKHLFDDHTPYRAVERIAGVDFGFTNPSVILTIDKDYDSNYWVRHEWYKTGKVNEELIQYAKTLNVNIFYPDPAEPDRIEEMKRSGLNCYDVSKDIEKGIDSVRTLIKNNRLRIHKDCLNLINEIETYSYPDKKPEKNEPELPIKEHDHAMDALRYALFMNMPVSVDETEDFNLYAGSFN